MLLSFGPANGRTFGVRARPRVALGSGGVIESDAGTHRTPKALRAKSGKHTSTSFCEAFGVRAGVLPA